MITFIRAAALFTFVCCIILAFDAGLAVLGIWEPVRPHPVSVVGINVLAALAALRLSQGRL